MLLRHRPPMLVPAVENIRNDVVRRFGEALGRLINDSLKDIYDDLVRILPEVVDDLPPPSAEYYQRFMITQNAGTFDTLYICLGSGESGSYGWRQVTLSGDTVVNVATLTMSASVEDPAVSV